MAGLMTTPPTVTAGRGALATQRQDFVSGAIGRFVPIEFAAGLSSGLSKGFVCS
jgi:hypothetical protein